MPTINLSLGKNSYQSVSLPFSAQRCINLYVNPAQAESAYNYMLRRSPGIVSWADISSYSSRGAVAMNGVYYVVMGNTLYSISQTGISTSLGTIAGTARVSMAHNGQKLCIVVPGGNGYVYDSGTSTFSQITDVDYRTADTVCFKDGYYVFSATDSNVFFNSALNDPLTFGALDFGTAEATPGNIVAVYANYDEVIVLKRDFSERFQNIGGSGFPFQRIPGASFEKGTHSKYSPIQWENAFYFVGGGANERPAIFRTGPNVLPVKISTDAISTQIQKFTDNEISDCFSFAYSINGIACVGFTFQSVNFTPKTFVYNITASQLFNQPIWFELQSGLIDNNWRVATIDFIYNKLIVSDLSDGRLGYLDADIYTEYDDSILAVKTLPPFGDGSRSLYVSNLRLILESGVGNLIDPGSDPIMALSWSDDGGRLWSSQLDRQMGKMGEYDRIVEWRRLGRTPAFRVHRLETSAPVPVSLIKAMINVKYGR